MLYDAAFNISFQEFKNNINTIGTLAVSLVFITASGMAVAAHYLIPGMTWPLSFILGAILSATDAVAAISITKGLGLSHKTNTILEGESLINDASALVAYRFAVAALTGTAFVFWKASLQFILLMAGGLFIDLAIGKILAFIIIRTKQNNLVTISFMILMPFLTYLIAEELHVSRVIAVVMLSLSIVQFPYVIKNISKDQVLPNIGYAFIINVLALTLRMARVLLQKINLQHVYKKGKGKITESALLDFKNSLIISWSGMRGIVSLAIAIGLPAELADGSPFPERNTIIFISVVVVLFTLIGQGLSLPWLVKRIKLNT